MNITDIHAERPLKSYVVYTIAKAGLAGLTRALARELGPEIRVNGVAPGADRSGPRTAGSTRSRASA